MRARRGRANHAAGVARGFTYVGLIIVVAIIALVAASTVKLGSLLQRRAAEEALLDVGAAFSDALKSYADASQPNQRKEPATLEELLRDPRFPGARRHLRKLFADPMTGSTQWGLVRTLDKVGIVGVYSLSEAVPIKQANFDARFTGFDNMQHLSQWKFMVAGGTTMPVEAQPAPAPPKSGDPTAIPKPGDPAAAAKAGAAPADGSAQVARQPGSAPPAPMPAPPAPESAPAPEPPAPPEPDPPAPAEPVADPAATQASDGAPSNQATAPPADAAQNSTPTSAQRR